MKDIFAQRAASSFHETLADLVESIEGTFTDRADAVEAWRQRGSAERRGGAIDDWITALEAPLQKGSAKYAKAVASVTKRDACVYHGAMYRDVGAVSKSWPDFALLCVEECVKEGRMTAADVTVLWQYVEEITKFAYSSRRSSPPVVPTTDDIAADIAKRRRANAAASSSMPLKHSVGELVAELMRGRGCACGEDEVVTATEALQTAAKGIERASTRCGERDSAVQDAVCLAIPALGTAPLTDAEWLICERAFVVCEMEDNIPAPMMRGIEQVANELVAGMHSGKVDLAKLDVGEIGKRVLGNVSANDMQTFANNLDKIMPGLTKL